MKKTDIAKKMSKAKNVVYADGTIRNRLYPGGFNNKKGRGSLNIPAKDKGGENPVMEGKNEHNRA